MTKGEETKRRILEQSAKVFNRLGYGSTSMSELMAATGLEKGGIYRHFESKEELACEAFSYSCDQVELERFAELEASAMNGLEKLESFVTTFAAIRSSIGGGCPLFNTAVEHDDGNPALKKRAKATYERWIKKLANFIEESKASGEIKKSTDSEQLASFTLCSLEGGLIAQRLTGNKEILKAQAEATLKHIREFKRQ